MKIEKKIFVFLNFHFFKIVIFGYFSFWAKNTQKIQKKCSKNGPNHQIALLSFTFHQKKSTFRHWPFFLDLWHGIAPLCTAPLCTAPLWTTPLCPNLSKLHLYELHLSVLYFSAINLADFFLKLDLSQNCLKTSPKGMCTVPCLPAVVVNPHGICRFLTFLLHHGNTWPVIYPHRYSHLL